jgi:hypothetical protein
MRADNEQAFSPFPRPNVSYLTTVGHACAYLASAPTSHHKLMQSDWEIHWIKGDLAEANADVILVQFCILAWFEALFLKSYSRLKTDTMADTDDNHSLGPYYVRLWLNVRVTYRLTISPRNIFLVHERNEIKHFKREQSASWIKWQH